MKRRRIAVAVAAGAVVLGTLTTLVSRIQPGCPVNEFKGEEGCEHLIRFPASQIREIPATQTIRYRAVPVNRMSETVGKARILRANLRKIGHLLDSHRGKGFQLRSGGTDIPNKLVWGRIRPLHETLERARYILSSTKVGAVLFLRAVSDHYKVKTTKVDLNPTKYLDTEGTTPIDIIIGTTISRFPTLQSYGVYVCKYVAGTHTLSQHAFANAVDWGGSTSVLDAVTKFQMDLWRKGWLPVSQILWKGHDLISGAGVTDHYDHVHDSGKPLLNYSSCHQA